MQLCLGLFVGHRNRNLHTMPQVPVQINTPEPGLIHVNRGVECRESDSQELGGGQSQGESGRVDHDVHARGVGDDCGVGLDAGTHVGDVPGDCSGCDEVGDGDAGEVQVGGEPGGCGARYWEDSLQGDLLGAQESDVVVVSCDQAPLASLQYVRKCQILTFRQKLTWCFSDSLRNTILSFQEPNKQKN